MNRIGPAFLFLFFLGTAEILSQPHSNLEVMYKMLDNSTAKADSLSGGEKSINLNLILPSTYEILRPKILDSFAKRGFSIKTNDANAPVSIDYTLAALRVEYKDAFTDGLFGGTLMERAVSINSSIIVKKNDKTVHPFMFQQSVNDTISLNETTTLETPSLPFTQSPVPSLPFLSNLWEPIIVSGTLIVSVILLFTVRSK